MPITDKKKDRLKTRMQALHIYEKDIEENFILGSGKGGQKVNKTNSCVHIIHKPTSISIKCQRQRSRELNRYYARCELCDKIDEIINREKSKKQKKIHKLKKQKQKRSKRAKEKILEKKKKHSKKMQLRKTPEID
jgi:peptide chain release factor